MIFTYESGKKAVLPHNFLVTSRLDPARFNKSKVKGCTEFEQNLK